MATKEVKHKKCSKEIPECSQDFTRAITDTIDFFSGKWKLAIVGTLMRGNKRFTDIQRIIPKITPRMLSKELRDLELNKVIKRTVYDSIPVSVEYEITDYGRSMDTVLVAMYKWGVAHRKQITSK
jgi:DNA-binding HxlR family transcriptional regulator